MVDDKPHDSGSDAESDTGSEFGAADSTRRPRKPPTIELEASRIDRPEPDTAPHGEGVAASGTTSADAPESPPRRETPPPGPARRVPLNVIVSALVGAAAAMVIGLVIWASGAMHDPNSLDVSTIATLETIGARVARLEEIPARPAVVQPDAALTERLDTMDKSLGSLREAVAAVRSQGDRVSKAVDDIKAAPRDAAAASDTSPPDERIAKLDAALQALSADVAQLKDAQAKTDLKADQAQAAQAKADKAAPADDMRLRRVIAATSLDLAVRQGEPFTAALTAAKPLAEDAAVLKPLEPFAAAGVPGAMVLSRELTMLLPQLVTTPEPAFGTGWLGRLEASAARLVKIRRTDAAAGGDNSAIISRAMAAAGRNDLAEAKHEIAALPPADRAKLQPWLDKVDARDAALAASRQFAAAATTALSNSAP